MFPLPPRRRAQKWENGTSLDPMPRGAPKPVALRQLEAGSHAGRSVVSHRPIPPRIEFSDSLADGTLIRCWEESVVRALGGAHRGEQRGGRPNPRSFEAG